LNEDLGVKGCAITTGSGLLAGLLAHSADESQLCAEFLKVIEGAAVTGVVAAVEEPAMAEVILAQARLAMQQAEAAKKACTVALLSSQSKNLASFMTSGSTQLDGFCGRWIGAQRNILPNYDNEFKAALAPGPKSPQGCTDQRIGPMSCIESLRKTVESSKKPKEDGFVSAFGQLTRGGQCNQCDMVAARNLLNDVPNENATLRDLFQEDFLKTCAETDNGKLCADAGGGQGSPGQSSSLLGSCWQGQCEVLEKCSSKQLGCKSLEHCSVKGQGDGAVRISEPKYCADAPHFGDERQISLRTACAPFLIPEGKLGSWDCDMTEQGKEGKCPADKRRCLWDGLEAWRQESARRGCQDMAPGAQCHAPDSTGVIHAGTCQATSTDTPHCDLGPSHRT
jgi:hypothetical protein